MNARHEFHRLADLLDVKTHPDRTTGWILWQLRALYQEIPGLALQLRDVQDAAGIDRQTSVTLLGTLVDVGFLRHDDQGFVMS